MRALNLDDISPLDPRSLANYILVVRKHFGYQTTNLELQKIAYFAYAKYLVSFGEKLCQGYFEAWDHGPVHPHIYREFKEFRAEPITRRAESVDIISGKKRVVPPPTDKIRRSHIAETVLQLRSLNASQLRKKSHAPGGPWHSVWTSAKINLASHVLIPDNVIKGGFNRHILLAHHDYFSEELDLEDHPPKAVCV